MRNLHRNSMSSVIRIYDGSFLFFRCRIWQFWTYASAYVSIYTLVLMSVDRFLAVVYPIESMTWRTEAKCVQAIIFTWVLTGLCCVPLIASHGESFPVPGNPNITYCIFSDNASVPLLPEAWDLRWNDTAFRVSTSTGNSFRRVENAMRPN